MCCLITLGARFARFDLFGLGTRFDLVGRGYRFVRGGFFTLGVLCDLFTLGVLGVLGTLGDLFTFDDLWSPPLPNLDTCFLTPENLFKMLLPS